MAINLDLSETQNPAKVGEFERVAPGPVHLQLKDFRENGGDKGEHIASFEVLMHNDTSQVGSTHREYFPAEAKMAWKLLTLAYALKVTTREEMERQKATGNPYVPLEFQPAIGRQLFGTIKVTEKNGSHYHNLTDMLATDDPKADRHPRNAGYLRAALGGAAPSPMIPQTTQAASSSPAPNVNAPANPFAAMT